MYIVAQVEFFLLLLQTPTLLSLFKNKERERRREGESFPLPFFFLKIAIQKSLFVSFFFHT
jgi:hypothetical protein